MEPQLPCPSTGCYSRPRAAGVVGPGPTKNRHGPRPSPPRTFVWGQQRRSMETPQQALWQEDFSPLQEPTLPSPPLPPLQVPTNSRLSSLMPVFLIPPSQPLPQPCLPPSTFLMTPELLHGFASELTLSLATAFTQISGAAVDMSALESAVSRITDRVVKQLMVTYVVDRSSFEPSSP